MIVLKILGWILLSVLAIVVLALCIRVGVDVEYSNEQTAVDLRYLFLKFRMYPSNKKKDQKQDEKSEDASLSREKETPAENADAQAESSSSGENAPAEAETAQESTGEAAAESAAEENKTAPPAEKKKDSLLKTLYDAEGVDGLITIVKKISSYTKTFFGNFLHAVVVDRLWLEVRCTRSDAASTAIYYGEVCGILFPMLGSLASRCRIRQFDVNVFPDYVARFSESSFFVSLHITPMYVIGVTLAYGIKLIFGVLFGLLVKLFLPKKENKKQEIQIKSKEKRESK